MGFTFLVWNVRHFKGTPPRTIQVRDHIQKHQPDVFSVLEVQKAAKEAIRRLVRDHFTEYDFGLTDSKRQLDILVGWRRGKFDQVVYTQRREFQANNIDLRPGGLLSFREQGETAFHNLLFLHTDSGRNEKDYKARQTMFDRVFHLKAALGQLPAQNGNARLIVLGDLNTMGRKSVNSQPSISGQEEINALQQDVQNAGMTMLSKSHDRTQSNGSNTRTSNLDHIIASNDLQFAEFFFPSNPSVTFNVEVDGWNNVPTGNARLAWIRDMSDHCALAGEVI